jgi:hypothetical protein
LLKVALNTIKPNQTHAIRMFLFIEYDLWFVVFFLVWAQTDCIRRCKFIFQVFNATFNNISVISWRSVLLMEKIEGPRENHRPTASHWQIISHNVVQLALLRESNPQHQMILEYEPFPSCRLQVCRVYVLWLFFFTLYNSGDNLSFKCLVYVTSPSWKIILASRYK